MITVFGLSDRASYEEVGALELLRSQGVPLRSILPSSATDADLHAARVILSQFYVDVIRYEPGELDQTRLLVSFGRPEVFDLLRESGERPAKVVYGLPSVGASKQEIAALADGLIDEVFTQSPKRALPSVASLVRAAGRGVEHRTGYVPFCNPVSAFTGLEFKERSSPVFKVLRDTPDSPEYAYSDHWAMVCGITVPRDREKHFTALGWGKQLSKAYGNPGNKKDKWHGALNATVFSASSSFSQRGQAYQDASALLHFYAADEVFCFQAAMAMVAGVVVVGCPLPAFTDLISHGETGYLARTPDEAAYLTSRLAWEPHLRAKTAANAYNWLVTRGPGNPDNCLPWWGPLLTWIQ
jgi:hypothetical protein